MNYTLPKPLERELHPLCSREILARVLYEVRSNPAVCIRDVARAVGCSDITAQKHLSRIVRAGLAIEKRVGRMRIFIKLNALEGEDPEA
jgi:predicted transcriptional regulator